MGVVRNGLNLTAVDYKELPLCATLFRVALLEFLHALLPQFGLLGIHLV